MSIFDVIKYPISMPPTQAELTALPTELYCDWHRLYLRPNTHIRFPETLALHYKLLYGIESRRPKIIEDINILRKMIKEYSRPII